MNENKIEKIESYNQIAKSFGLFGGVQVFGILISIVRSKFVAVLLGTTGIGVLGLFTSTLGILAMISNFGLNVSAVSAISKASVTGNHRLISKSIVTIKRWFIFSGILGAILTLILSTRLSQWIFGSNSYTWGFIFLSIAIFFQTLSTGMSALLQGLRKLKELAIVGILGSSIGLVISVILFYLYGVKGIIPSLIITAIIIYFVSWYLVRKIKVDNIKISINESYVDGIEMIKVGMVLLITNLVGTLVLYITQLFINQTGGLDQLGLYLSSFAIINGYFGIIFTAMGTDLFPRISAISDNNIEIKKMINQQSEIMMLILGPILIFLISFLPFVIKVLLSSKFLPMIGLLKWAILGVVFQSVSYPLGLVFAAKGYKKTYFFIVMSLHGVTLLAYVILYYFLKLEGIGIAFLLIHFLFLFILLRLAYLKFSFMYDSVFIKLFTIQFIFIISAFLIVFLFGFPIAYYAGIILTIISIFYSYKEIKNRIDIDLIFQKINKFWKPRFIKE
jgi:O-antigen/teichoic acid export membrane protein